MLVFLVTAKEIWQKVWRQELSPYPSMVVILDHSMYVHILCKNLLILDIDFLNANKKLLINFIKKYLPKMSGIYQTSKV